MLIRPDVLEEICAQASGWTAEREEKEELTVFVALDHPSVTFNHPSSSPQILHTIFRVLETLFHLDAFVGFNGLTQYRRIADRRIEGLVSPTLDVINIFPYYLPILEFELLASEHFIGVSKAIEDEPRDTVSQHIQNTPASRLTGELFLDDLYRNV